MLTGYAYVGVIRTGTVSKFSKSGRRFYPGFSKTEKIRVVQVNKSR